MSKDGDLNRDFIYTVPSRILFDSDLTLVDLKLYMLIRSFMDTTNSCYPSNNWIADKLQIERRSVIRSLQRLIEKQYILRLEKNGKRYLCINITNCPEDLVTSESPPCDNSVTPPSDISVTQITSNISNSKLIKNLVELNKNETVFDDIVDARLLNVRRSANTLSDIDDNEFLAICKAHIEKQDNKYNFQQRVAGLCKLIAMGTFQAPTEYKNKKQEEIHRIRQEEKKKIFNQKQDDLHSKRMEEYQNIRIDSNPKQESYKSKCSLDAMLERIGKKIQCITPS